MTRRAASPSAIRPGYVLLGDEAIMKFLRRFEEGINPGVELAGQRVAVITATWRISEPVVNTGACMRAAGALVTGVSWGGAPTGS